MQRKVVILGDTYDATAMLPISQGADVNPFVSCFKT